MPFSDLHLHPTLKCLFSDPPAKLSPWDKIDIRKIPPLVRWCSDFEYILQSQSNLSQLVNNEYSLVCIALYIPEIAMLDNDLVLGEADGSLKAYLNKDKINKIINGIKQPYRDLMAEDINSIFDGKQFGITDKKVVALTRDIDPDKNDGKTIYAVFSLEGCHSLSSGLRKFDVTEIIKNLDDLRTKLPLISLNLTHLEQSAICNHAFGILFLDDEAFKPTGRGISAAGIQIIKHCYLKGILIDVKHMSVFSRQIFYQLRISQEFQVINQALVCTHAGFTGISIKDIPDYIYDYKISKGYTQIQNGKPILYGKNVRPAFNASSINLYDDDIIQILQSGGIIGLSLDKRILGFHEDENDSTERSEYPMDIEYMSVKEDSIYFSSDEVGNAFLNNKCLGWEELEEAGKVNPMISDYHLHHFMAHILHLIVVARNNNYNVSTALTQVCIGSDFDGIINPVWCCDTADEMVYFKQAFEKAFIDFAGECDIDLPNGFNITQFSEALFYENGKKFIIQRLVALKS